MWPTSWFETRLTALLAMRLPMVAGAFIALAAVPALAEPDYPAFTGRVVDAAHVLSDADRDALTRKLADLRDKTNVQFAVATVPSLGGLEIEPYANALFRKWGIGQKGADNGLLLILAPTEHKLRFEVGYGLEGTLTDAQSKLILRNDMVPKLKAGDPAGALKAGVDDAIAVLTGKDAALPRGTSRQDDGTPALIVSLLVYGVPLFILVIWILIVVLAIRGKARWRTGSGWSAPYGSPFSGDSSSIDSSSSGSSDGFSGGGGGDSGGGGASDSY